MTTAAPFHVGGYVLAGGRSSRMGADKALLQLAGKPLIHYAVSKLRRVCADVHILSSNPELAAYAPLVHDLHPDCGPAGGMEAGLAHSPHVWNLFLAVDMPFLPSGLIWAALSQWLADINGPRIHIFTADDRPQPGFCLIHKEVAPILSQAIGQGDFKLMRVFEAAVRELAVRHGSPPQAELWQIPVDTNALAASASAMPAWCAVNPLQLEGQSLWFANLNTPDDFVEAEARPSALDL
jgi:molybdopterin-guanine dinucleotide biosynthesis protein A